MRLDVANSEARADSAQNEPEAGSLPAPSASTPARPLRLLVAAGGTGGHVFPALAIAQELVVRGSCSPGALQFLGTARGLEARLIEGAGFSYRMLAAAGLKGIGGWRRMRNAAVLPRTCLEALAALRAFRPDVVLGLGGYVAGPVLLEAALLRVPTVLVEPNASPGFTNKALAPFVSLAAVGFEETARAFRGKARVTGLPVRREFFDLPPRQHRPPFTILVFGGSQGSEAINHCIVESLSLLATRPLALVHQTGERQAEAVREVYQKAKARGEVYAFIDDMPAMFSRADLIVSRSGASTVGEIAAAGKAAVLVPFPGATDQHQLGNARALERAGAARVIEQANLSPERLMREVDDLINSPERLAAMETAARSLARRDASARIADLIEELATQKHRHGKGEDRSSAR
jgi:UDP-N-acetylglucosamine--N-acetylmuramyl-(pentapeptide) pyrophosphoryl-undecaprenol N-acetylglucosamine transferase